MSIIVITGTSTDFFNVHDCKNLSDDSGTELADRGADQLRNATTRPSGAR